MQHVPEYPAPDSVQRVSDQFWNSDPKYSQPPPSLISMAPPPVVQSDPSRALFARVLFCALFVPMLALLALVLMR